MSSHFTQELRGVSVSNLIRVNVPAREWSEKEDGDGWGPVGSIATLYSPRKHFKSDLYEQIEPLLMLHDRYMSARCTCMSWEISQSPQFSYMFGRMKFELAEASGSTYYRSVPVLFAPDTRYTWASSSLDYFKKHQEHSYVCTERAGCRGLFCQYGIIVKASHPDEADRMDPTGTWMHEAAHAMYHLMPNIKDNMYGDSPEVSVEESIVHIMTDHRSILNHIADAKVQFNVYSVPGSRLTKSEGKRSIYQVLDYSVASWGSVHVNGSPLSVTEVKLDDEDYVGREEIVDRVQTYYSRA